MISDAALLALVHLVFLQGVGRVAWEIALSSIYGPPAECNSTPLHLWLYYTQAEKSEHPWPGEEKVCQDHFLRGTELRITYVGSKENSLVTYTTTIKNLQ